jgi:LmbE family N-acetylglucosaminyl deacetylase
MPPRGWPAARDPPTPPGSTEDRGGRGQQADDRALAARRQTVLNEQRPHLIDVCRHHARQMHPASRDQALDAVQAFHAERGRLPRWREWERATESRPCTKTIELRWGWRELLAEAMGVRPNEVEVSWVSVLDGRAEAMLAALRAARAELERWPTAAEWDRSGWRPTSKTLVRHFGGWKEGCGAASGMKAMPPGPARPAGGCWTGRGPGC